MALAGARPVFCRLRAEKPASPEPQRLKVAEESGGAAKIVLQPRVCTLRSFGGDRGGVIRANNRAEDDEVSRFFEILSDYVESSKKSHDFEIMSGRLAMIVFAATVGMEIVTGNSVFRKMDLQGIEEAGGVCVAAIASAAVFAWFSSNRSRVGRIFTTGCNTFIDSLIDNIIDGLFYDVDLSDWSDDI
ncbi:stress enhanced protein 2 [Perilla frutescens var. hirtella]|uniref:Stress enhanced protein 2 n=1 Tax=Perilla frutescens var. hirtella TaxID=608512 RepID=A0AAD4JHU2_PERFH|nr:stress enhanced protein 2 [Perilla frutescens var. hirtella]KAH6833691.1 stress enhanced protein 2 [Perilla frutescens var. hirtella]